MTTLETKRTLVSSTRRFVILISKNLNKKLYLSQSGKNHIPKLILQVQFMFLLLRSLFLPELLLKQENNGFQDPFDVRLSLSSSPSSFFFAYSSSSSKRKVLVFCMITSVVGMADLRIAQKCLAILIISKKLICILKIN